MSLLQLLRPVVYVRLAPEVLSVRDVGSARTVEEPPLAAVSREPKRRVLGVGEAARTAAAAQAADLVNPFQHPRTLLADFTVGEAVLRGFLRKLYAGRLFAVAPIMVLHPKVDPAGGFTQIELRALRELGMGAGAREVHVRTGRDLTDAELRDGRFGADGKLLDA